MFQYAIVSISMALLASHSPPFLQAADEKVEIDALLRQFSGNVQEFATVLKTVNDNATAGSVLPKLNELSTNLRTISAKIASSKLSKQELASARMRHEGELNSIEEAIAQFNRINKIPDAFRFLGGVPFLKDLAAIQKLEGEKVRIAIANLKALEKIIDIYKTSEGHYPQTLQTLTKRAEGKFAYLDQGDLKDPWGNDYRYESSGPKHKGEKPDLWVETPSKRIIGNWQPGQK